MVVLTNSNIKRINMKNILKLFINIYCIFVLSSLFVTVTYSQDNSLLTIDRIYNSTEFYSERFGPARWLEDGSGYTTLEQSISPLGGRDIIKYDPYTGNKEVLVSANSLVPNGENTPLQISDYHWSPDGTRLLVFTNTRRVWRQNTRGDYWVFEMKSKDLYKIGGDAESTRLMFATFSPDSKNIGYVYYNNVYTQNLESKQISQLTSDGTEDIINGTFDWVYEEELALQNGFRWSPDSKKIAFWQLDKSGVGEYLMLNTTDDIYSKIIPVQYPKVGTTNSSARIGVVTITGEDKIWLNIPDDLRNNYVARMDWAANSEEIVFQRLNRLQNTNKVMLGNAVTGATRVILTEKDDAWIDINDDLQWMDGGKYFTWVSERDGWRHAYLVSKDGSQIYPLTPGNFDILSIQRIDEKGGWLYYIASPDDATQRYLYRSKIITKGNPENRRPERLTPSNKIGTHSYQISHDTKWAIHTFSNTETPPVIDLVSLPDHKIKKTFTENSKLNSTFDKLKKQPVEFHKIKVAGDLEFDVFVMKPHNFDETKKYPVLFYVYGEPWNQTVMNSWGGSTYLWHLMLTQKGYVVMSIDNRGTPGPKGREWRKSVYRKIGIIASQDQAAVTKKIISMWDYVDTDRIGIWGWSGGGSMTLNMMFRYPDIYKTGMSIAPVGDQKLYDTIYQERYMGLPDDNIEGYRDGSPVNFAKYLQGNLLIVHGTGDDNVHYQNTEYIVNELIKHNKQFQMMAYPNRSHGIFEGENTTRHLRTMLTNFLLDKMPPGGVSK